MKQVIVIANVTYEFRDSNGCTNSAVDTIWVDNCLSVEDISRNNISFTYNTELSRIIVSGKNIHQFDYVLYVDFRRTVKIGECSEEDIDIAFLKSGLYFFRIYDNETIQVWGISKL